MTMMDVEEDYLKILTPQHLLGRIATLERLVQSLITQAPPEKLRTTYYSLKMSADRARDQANRTASDLRIDYADGVWEISNDFCQFIEEFIAGEYPDEEVPDWESMKGD